MCGDNRYAMENILIHEFGHTVMNVRVWTGCGAEGRDGVRGRIGMQDILMPQY